METVHQSVNDVVSDTSTVHAWQMMPLNSRQSAVGMRTIKGAL